LSKRINWHLIRRELVEAREELEAFERELDDVRRRSEMSLRPRVEHAHHHLNFAWNARARNQNGISAALGGSIQPLEHVPQGHGCLRR
jgi:hypothetical protein